MATIRNGEIIPDFADVKKALETLSADVKQNPELLRELRTNPGIVLGGRGLSKSIQQELIRENDPAAAGVTPDCVVSCFCTSCGALSFSIG